MSGREIVHDLSINPSAGEEVEVSIETTDSGERVE